MAEFIYCKITLMGKQKVITIPKSEVEFEEGKYVRVELAK